MQTVGIAFIAILNVLNFSTKYFKETHESVCNFRNFFKTKWQIKVGFLTVKKGFRHDVCRQPVRSDCVVAEGDVSLRRSEAHKMSYVSPASIIIQESTGANGFMTDRQWHVSAIQ